jgi:hypothetical protein
MNKSAPHKGSLMTDGRTASRLSRDTTTRHAHSVPHATNPCPQGYTMTAQPSPPRKSTWLSAASPSAYEMLHPRKMPQRLPQPGLNHGRLQTVTRRLFLLSDVVTTAMVVAAGYARKRRPTPRDYEAARRALARYADPIGRGGGRGRPILWRLRNSSAEK